MNIYLENKDEGDSMAEYIVQMAKDYANVELITTANAEKADIPDTADESTWPGDTGETSWGWCDPSAI